MVGDASLAFAFVEAVFASGIEIATSGSGPDSGVESGVIVEASPCAVAESALEEEAEESLSASKTSLEFLEVSFTADDSSLWSVGETSNGSVEDGASSGALPFSASGAVRMPASLKVGSIDIGVSRAPSEGSD